MKTIENLKRKETMNKNNKEKLKGNVTNFMELLIEIIGKNMKDSLVMKQIKNGNDTSPKNKNNASKMFCYASNEKISKSVTKHNDTEPGRIKSLRKNEINPFALPKKSDFKTKLFSAESQFVNEIVSVLYKPQDIKP